MSALSAVVLGLSVAAVVCADLRWLRVAQREHYLRGAALRFAWRWWALIPSNCALGVAGVAGAAIAAIFPGAGLLTACVVALGPIGLSLKGRTSRLVWTRRLAFVAGLTGLVEALAITLGAGLGALSGATLAAVFCALAAPVFVDAALALLRPLEDTLAERHVKEAADLLARVNPQVVAITGSYGKTTTKNYLAYFLGGDRNVVASPRSFNNRAGLTRTVKEHLSANTEVLIAEMGAYGPGEIAALCEWLRPEIAVITSIGPAHLERFGTLDRTLAAKAEITAGARVVVLNVDDSRLEGLAKSLDSTHKVIRASGEDPSADVAVLAHGGGLQLITSGKPNGLAELAPGSPAPIRTNAACAAAVAIELGIAPETVATRLGTLPGVPNRLQAHRAEGGYCVLDDTFNSNPAGARHAIEALASAAPAGRRMVVTPGMVELGKSQREENAAFAEIASKSATDLVVVGRTNRAALVEGWHRGHLAQAVKLVEKREQAVQWARSQLGPDDAVLFENDLPDHFS